MRRRTTREGNSSFEMISEGDNQYIATVEQIQAIVNDKVQKYTAVIKSFERPGKPEVSENPLVNLLITSLFVLPRT